MRPEVASTSLRGRARRWNGDHLGVDLERGMLVLADGGRASASLQAAQVAVDAVLANLRGSSPPPAPPGDALRRAMEAAHRVLVEARTAPEEPLEVTLVACVVRDGRAWVAHVGNTRAYLLGRRGLCQVTRDHTWVGERVAHGLLSPREARAHPFRGAITQYLGGDPAPEVEVREVEVLPSERVLLCTDGLWEGVSDFQLWDLGTRGGALQEALEALVGRSVAQCGEDDASAVLWQGEACPSKLDKAGSTGVQGVRPALQLRS